MAGNLVDFTDATFQSEVINSDTPVLVDFWAPWCGPCRMLTPTIEQLADQFSGRVKIGKVNTDDNQQTAVDYAVNSIPTVMLFHKGEMIDKLVGPYPKAHYEQMLNSVLESA
ncbi:MAG: thioredoxin [Planctomycetaceae bacterium]|nr:thioredoxin [Planctomycetaceae bacterium]